jgi:antitoxin (DNA-binding transcriptional repressor) of toxin-antitoxin stability system
MVTLTVSQARASLPELLTRVEDGEEVTITRHGRPVAVLVRPDVMRSRATVIIEIADRIHELVSESGLTARSPRRKSGPAGETAEADSTPSGKPGLTPDRADELVREIRAGRDTR